MSKHNEYLSVYPENLKKYKNLKTIANNFTENFDVEVTSKINLLKIYQEMENQKEETLDKLAWQWDVDFYSSELPKSQKIDLIKNSLYFNSTKGTRAVLQQSLDAVFFGITIEEWFQATPKMLPYTFNLYAINPIFSTQKIDEILRMVKYYKNARSTLNRFYIRADLKSKTKEVCVDHICIKLIDKYVEI